MSTNTVTPPHQETDSPSQSPPHMAAAATVSYVPPVRPVPPARRVRVGVAGTGIPGAATGASPVVPESNVPARSTSENVNSSEIVRTRSNTALHNFPPPTVPSGPAKLRPLPPELLKSLDATLERKRHTNVPQIATKQFTFDTHLSPVRKASQSHRRTASVGTHASIKHKNSSDDLLSTGEDHQSEPALRNIIPGKDRARNDKRKSAGINLKGRILGGVEKLTDTVTNRPAHREEGGSGSWTSASSSDNVVEGHLQAIKEDFANSLLVYSLELLGLTDQQLAEITLRVTQTAKSSSINGDHFTPHELDIFREIRLRVDQILDTTSKQSDAIKIQSLFRMHLVRKRLCPILKNESVLARTIRYNNSFYKFLEAEKEYCARLDMLIERYLAPVRQKLTQGKEVLRIEDISYIFCNIESIKETHANLLQQLQTICNEKWPFIDGVGRAILDQRKGLEAYGVYVINHQNARDIVNRLKSEKNSKFSTWLQEVESKYPDGKEFITLLEEPVKHISEMAKHLENLAKYAENRLDEQEINDTHVMIHQTNIFVKEHLLRSKATADLMNIQRRIIGNEKPLNLIKQDRRILAEASFVNNNHKKPKHFVLFSDLLIVGTLSRSNQIRFLSKTPIEVIQYEDVSSDKTAFVIKTPAEVFRLTASKPEEKKQWLTLLEQCKNNSKQNRTIGVSIRDILKREENSNGIPSIITQCIDRIRSFPSALETEGLFRISGEARQIDALKDIFDNFAPHERDLTPYSIHAIAGVLKLFLRSLPEPLLTFALYDPLIDTERTFGDTMTEENIKQFKEFFKQLGPHYPTLEYLMKFLVEVCACNTTNKMSPNNLAIVFGPTLMRPEVETMETTLNSPLVNHTVQRIIEHAKELFEL